MKYLKLILPLIFVAAVELLMKFSSRTLCLWKNLTGHDCLGCGITRAFHALFHFHFREAFEYNNLIVIVAPLMLFLWFKLIQKDDFKS